jgi:hypothetical protein
LPVVSKLLERAVHQQLSTYLDENNLLSLQQFGFTDDAALQHLQRLTTVYCWKNCLAVESVIMILSGFNHTSRIGIKLCIMIMRTLTIKQPVQIGVVQDLLWAHYCLQCSWMIYPTSLTTVKLHYIYADDATIYQRLYTMRTNVFIIMILKATSMLIWTYCYWLADEGKPSYFKCLEV